MGLIVGSITARGFLSYREEQTLHLGGRGAVAIVGENGAGKSTMTAKALTWCMYGKCPPEKMGDSTRALKRVVGDYCENAEVTTELIDLGTGEIKTVRRVQASGLKSAVFINDEGAFQENVDALIGVGYEVFTRTVVRGQGDPWAFAEATDKRKREILDSISGADKLIGPYDKARQARQDADRSAIEMTKMKVTAETQLAAAESQVDVYSRRELEWDEDFCYRVEAVEIEIEAFEKSEAAAEAAEKVELERAVDHAAVLKDEPSLDRKPYQDPIDQSNKMLADLKAELRAIEATRATMEELSPGDPCPTCEIPLAADGPLIKRKIEAESAARGKLLDIEGVTETRDDRAAVLNDAEDWHHAAQNVWKDKVAALAPKSTVSAAGAKRLTGEAHKRLEAVKAAENPHTVALGTWKERATLIKRHLVVLNAAVRELNHQAELAQAWEKALSSKGVRAHIADSSLAAIEAESNKWLGALWTGATIAFPATREVKGRTKEEIQTVVTLNGRERDLLAFSGGQRRRINIAVDLGVASAFTRGGGLALSLLVLDEEVFSGLDEKGKVDVVRALASMKVADVVVIDHDPRLSAAMPRTVEVTLTNEGSKLQEVVAHV